MNRTRREYSVVHPVTGYVFVFTCRFAAAELAAKLGSGATVGI